MKRLEKLAFHPGFDIWPTKEPLGFEYGRDVFGPVPEIRRLDDIRSSLEDPQSKGPEEVYAIVMDVGLAADREEIVGPIYTQFQKDRDRFLFVSDPGRCPELWADFRV